MAEDDSNATHEPTRSLPAPSCGTDWKLFLFLALAIVAVLLPHISIPLFGVYWAAAVAVVVSFVWFTVMPTTCINGGLIYSFVAMAVLFTTLGIVLIAVIGLVLSAIT